jgi:hypothetical protein
MRTRGAAIQGGLAALGLVAAYATWQREPERAPGEATVLDISKGDLNKVRYEDGAKWVEIEQKPDPSGEGMSSWLRLAPKPSPAPAPERYVRGNPGADKLLDKLAPLHATRALGVLEAAKLKEFGLEAPKKKLMITARGQTHLFDVGTSPYGVSDPYVKDVRDGRVYVLGGGIIGDLDSAPTRLLDRTLHGWKPAEWDGLVITEGAKKRELVQLTGDKPTDVKLASKKTNKPDTEAKNWHDKVFRLVVSEVLGQGETPSGGAPQVLLKLEYTFKGKPKGWLEIGRVAAPPPAIQAASMPPQAGPLYARSERTAGWMKLAGTAEDVVKEVDKVVAGE